MTPEAVLGLMGLPGDQAMTAAQTATMISHVIVHVGQEFQTTAATVEQATSATSALRVEVDKALITNKASADAAAQELKETLNQQDFKLGEIDSDMKDAILRVTSNIAQVEKLGAEFRQLYATCEVSFQQNTAQATDRMLDIQRQVQNLVERTFQGGDDGGKGGGGGHQPRDR